MLRGGARSLALAVMTGIVMAACSSSSPRAASRSTTPQSPSGSSISPVSVTLAAAPARLRKECVTAAQRLGFAVPCQSKVPTVSGRAASCPVPVGAMVAPCVGREGLAGYLIFAFELNGFDVPAGYIGVGGKAVGHLFIEARPHKFSPDTPCIGAIRIQLLRVGRWMATEYSCPEDSLAVQREAMHGEGAYAGHLLLEWKYNGVDYLVSAHGHTAENLALLEELASSVTLVPVLTPSAQPTS